MYGSIAGSQVEIDETNNTMTVDCVCASAPVMHRAHDAGSQHSFLPQRTLWRHSPITAPE
jgi:hypothetical protein